MIRSHLVNPSFQQSCKNIFTNEKIIGFSNEKTGDQGRGCKYTKGSVKLRDRCIVKSRIDYNDRNWPKTSNILDFLRCSVVCDNPKILNDVITNFIQLVGNHKSESIKSILRIKNGFQHVHSKMPLNEFNYCDIKMNVLIEYNKMSIVGEIQFLLKFMLDAKKIGHSFYALQRKKEYFEELYLINNKINLNRDNFIEHLLQTQILSQNKNEFSKLLQLLSQKELNMIKDNKSHILSKIRQNHWKKGEKIFVQTIE